MAKHPIDTDIRKELLDQRAKPYSPQSFRSLRPRGTYWPMTRNNVSSALRWCGLYAAAVDLVSSDVRQLTGRFCVQLSPVRLRAFDDVDIVAAVYGSFVEAVTDIEVVRWHRRVLVYFTIKSI